MGENTEPVLGTADIWEPEISEWTWLEAAARDLFHRYGYAEVRTPVFERTELFVRGIGTETDVVQKEMYTFEDRGGRSLTLRPEGTAGVMRAIVNNGFVGNEERRVFYMGPMFRGERPAAGRRRQFHQVGVEAVGGTHPNADAECIAMLLHFLDAIGIANGRLLLNSRGLDTDRETVAAALGRHFALCVQSMCADCQRRLSTNVWRILDCKNEPCQAPIAAAPHIVDLLGDDSRAFFRRVCEALERLGVAYEVAPRLVRGLDYYVHTVFEVVHDGLGAQNALAGGGRYRVHLPGLNRPVDGVGFAAGMERLILARQSLGQAAVPAATCQVYVASLGTAAVEPGMRLAQSLRRAAVSTLAELAGERSLKAQLRTANRAGARLALILGDNEMANRTVVCRDMQTSEQQERPLDSALAWVRENLAKPAAAATT